ncbi:MAG: tyrosine-type recombinase/integrase [Armatimonadetes bacterium]|nr:tyrosine-type recombinase/integrase [Akkermansiaceae bacterium]
MASYYRRPNTKHFSLACYPCPGSKLVRASLGTDDPVLAEKMTRKVEILCELEKLADVPIPEKLLAAFSLSSIRSDCERPTPLEPSPPQAVAAVAVAAQAPMDTSESGTVREALVAYMVRSLVCNVPQAQADKISRLRQFFGSDLINSLDPRPPENLKHARKGKVIPPVFEGKYLYEITELVILKFLIKKKYGLSSKRHFRELFHAIFEGALKSGIYKPPNPYCANPVDDLPGFTGRDKPVTVLTVAEVVAQYAAVSAEPLVLFGCQLRLEAGFRLHEILALRPCDLATEGKIRLILPQNPNPSGTGLKTGERTITVRHELRPIIRQYLESYEGDYVSWCFQSPTGLRMATDAFGESLRTMNRAANLTWTSQDYRHTFATRRISEGWNLKTLAQEMGTSVAMLMIHYAGYIEPPIHAAQSSM